MSNLIKVYNKDEYFRLENCAIGMREGEIAVFPTETVYGVGTSALDKEAVNKLYELKNREYSEPISVLISNFDMIDDVAKDVTKLERKIMEKFFPGPLTIILKKKENLPDVLNINGDTIGVRMPQNDIALKLIEYSKVPIATTSANLAGKSSNTSINSIIYDFKSNVDWYVDGGECKVGVASTVLKVENDQIKILREGSITKEQILEACFD